MRLIMPPNVLINCPLRFQKAYKGELAEKFIDANFFWLESKMELIVLKVTVNDVEVDKIPRLDADNCTILNGQGGTDGGQAIVYEYF